MKLAIFLIFVLMFTVQCEDTTAKSKSMYGMSAATDLEGNFPNLKKLSKLLTDTTPTDLSEIAEYAYDQDTLNQIDRYIANQIDRISELEEAYALAEAGDPIPFRSLLELESREIKDIYLTLTLPDGEVADFIPFSNDLLAIFFLKLRQSDKNEMLLRSFSELKSMTSEELESERVVLYNILAREYFSDDKYRTLKEGNSFRDEAEKLKTYLQQLESHFGKMYEGEASEFPESSSSPTKVKGKSTIFLKWLQGYSSENSMDLFSSGKEKYYSKELMDELKNEGAEEEGEGEEIASDDPYYKEWKPKSETGETITTDMGSQNDLESDQDTGSKDKDNFDAPTEETDSKMKLVMSETMVLQYKDGFRSGRSPYLEKRRSVKVFQRMLKKVGYAITPDGFYGTDTLKIIILVHQDLNLPTTDGKTISQSLYNTIQTQANSTQPQPIDYQVSGHEFYPVRQTQLASIKVAPRCFGCSRGTRKHAGIDIYAPGCTEDQRPDVFSIDEGKVIGKRGFYGLGDGRTWQVVVQHPHFTIRYTEMDKNSIPSDIKIGAVVHLGQKLGKIGRIKTNDGWYRKCMLHMEIYESGTATSWLTKPSDSTNSNRYYLEFSRIRALRNPTSFVTALHQEYLRQSVTPNQTVTQSQTP